MTDIYVIYILLYGFGGFVIGLNIRHMGFGLILSTMWGSAIFALFKATGLF